MAGFALIIVGFLIIVIVVIMVIGATMNSIDDTTISILNHMIDIEETKEQEIETLVNQVVNDKMNLLIETLRGNNPIQHLFDDENCSKSQLDLLSEAYIKAKLDKMNKKGE